MSSGFQALALALHVCGTVHVYGFSQGGGHYFAKESARTDDTPFELRHPWPLERACLADLGHKLPKVKLHS